jgi:hypothetical protein
VPAQKCKILQACGHNTEVKNVSRFTCRNFFFERLYMLHDFFFFLLGLQEIFEIFYPPPSKIKWSAPKLRLYKNDVPSLDPRLLSRTSYAELLILLNLLESLIFPVCLDWARNVNDVNLCRRGGGMAQFFSEIYTLLVILFRQF